MLAKLCRTGFSVWRQPRNFTAVSSLKENANSWQSIHLQWNNNYCSSTNTIAVVQYDEIKRLGDHPEKLLIDVREGHELQETGQIPHSINIPLSSVGEQLSADADKFKAKHGRQKPQFNTEIIFHCKSGKRSLQAALAAQALGYTNIKNYEGSWLDWAERESLAK